MGKENKEQIEAVKNDVRTYSSLEAVANSSGGQILVKSLKKDIVSAIDRLTSLYKTAPEIELRAACATLGERITLLRVLSRAPKNKKYSLKELEELSTVDNDEE